MNFEEILPALRTGGRAQRKGWSGWVVYIPEGGAQVAHKFADGARPLPFLAVRLPGDRLIPWVPGHSDLLAGDWVLRAAVPYAPYPNPPSSSVSPQAASVGREAHPSNDLTRPGEGAIMERGAAAEGHARASETRAQRPVTDVEQEQPS